MTATAGARLLACSASTRPASTRESYWGRDRFPMLAITLRQHGNGLRLAVLAACITAAILVGTGLLLHSAHFFGGRADWTWETGGPAYPWRHINDVAYPWRTWNGLMRTGWAIVSVCAGVPLVCREVEDGTGAFAWTQGIPKTRWLLGKLLPVAGLLGLTAAAFGVLYAWWFSALGRAGIYAWSGFALYPPHAARLPQAVPHRNHAEGRKHHDHRKRFEAGAEAVRQADERRRKIGGTAKIAT